MMKRLAFFIVLVLPMGLLAQVQFGYLNYHTIMCEMPEYTQAQQELATLKGKYEAESTRSEEEFQKKFVDFLQGQKDFPQSIMQKRQGELQSLMDNGVQFRLQAQKLIAQAEKDLLGEVEKRLNRAILEDSSPDARGTACRGPACCSRRRGTADGSARSTACHTAGNSTRGKAGNGA